MLKRFFKDGVVYGLAGLFARSVSIITLPLYTRVLSPTDFGVIDLTLLFTVFCGVIIPFGISTCGPISNNRSIALMTLRNCGC